jgi:hypothetical protein
MQEASQFHRIYRFLVGVERRRLFDQFIAVVLHLPSTHRLAI